MSKVVLDSGLGKLLKNSATRAGVSVETVVRVLEAVAYERNKPCDHCDTDGVFTESGEGPFDCYACGAKANNSKQK